MNEECRKYIIKNFFKENFFENTCDGTYKLEETD